MNRINIIGRLTKDPELKSTSSGFSISRFSIAVNKSQKKGDIYEDKACFFECVVFGKQADTAQKYLEKGHRVGIDGSLDWESWQDKDGNRKSKIQIVIDKFFFLEPRKESGGPNVSYSRDDEDIPM